MIGLIIDTWNSQSLRLGVDHSFFELHTNIESLGQIHHYRRSFQRVSDLVLTDELLLVYAFGYHHRCRCPDEIRTILELHAVPNLRR